MRWILLMIMSLTISGCLGNLEKTDFATAGGSVIGVGIATAAGLPPLPTIASTVVGATAGAVLVGPDETTVDVLEAIPEDQRAAALKNKNMWMAIESLGWYAILAVLGFFLLPLIIGYFIPNGKQRKMEKAMYNDPNYRR